MDDDNPLEHPPVDPGYVPKRDRQVPVDWWSHGGTVPTGMALALRRRISKRIQRRELTNQWNQAVPEPGRDSDWGLVRHQPPFAPSSTTIDSTWVDRSGILQTVCHT
ncbi:MAG TPA: hypothetical protein DDY91_23555 [Planctomycetaceae bacterium]|nr:hypothetical protein [Planctomycetaceae bacterium]